MKNYFKNNQTLFIDRTAKWTELAVYKTNICNRKIWKCKIGIIKSLPNVLFDWKSNIWRSRLFRLKIVFHDYHRFVFFP